MSTTNKQPYFDWPTLFPTVMYFRAFSHHQIVSTLSRQLHWSNFLELIYLKEPLARDFYVQMCGIERWSVRTLRKQVGSLLFERTMAAKQPEKCLRRD
ncbi:MULTISPECIES: DUF1016 N-terminal domain-containing protein [unclassified Endozoicomonas]|uniref:DUF1016 N-terminal domain-containing protein n=1 Tax=unclassified Endozoicomonas TaxID=2644528 RepID=UPI003BB765E3